MNGGSGGKAVVSMEDANDDMWDRLFALPDMDQGVSIRPSIRWFLWHCVPICGFVHSVSIQWYILRFVAALLCASALLLDKNAVEQCACCSSLTNVRHHRRVYIYMYTCETPQAQKVFRFQTDEHAL